MPLQEPLQKASIPPAENHTHNRPVSERKILANRKNALRSTGPRTDRGKRTVSRNAIAHGILAREAVISAGDGEESQEEFDALAQSLWEHYEPVGPVEGMFVEKIAVSWWRQARAIRAENGEVRKRLDTLSMDRAWRNSDKDNMAYLLFLGDTALFNSENAADAKLSTLD